MNRVILVGRITKDPELRYTNTNIPVVQFTIAVNRKFQGANGERQADFINCVVWRQAAENLSKYIKKGGLLGIEGQIQTRTYDDPSGQRRYITEVVCDSVNFLEPKGTGTSRGAFDVNQYDIPEAPRGNGYNQNNNFGQQNNNYGQQNNNYGRQNNQANQEPDPFEELQKDYNFSDDDLPF